MTLATQLEQSLELPSSVMMGLADSMGSELDKVYRLNRLYMEGDQYFVIDDTVQKVSKEDYASDLRVQPIFDPKQMTQAQKVALAQAELQASLQNPNNQARPQVIDFAFKNYLTKIGAEDVDELVPPPPQPLRIDDQNEETTLMMMPNHPPLDVFPDQNHAEHVAKLQQFMQQDFMQNIPPEAQQEIAQHLQKHIAYIYGQTAGVDISGLGQGITGQAAQGQPGAPAGMGPSAGDAGGFGPIVPPLPGLEGGPTPANMGGPAPAGGARPGAG